MTKRRALWFGLWTVVTLAAIAWLAAGNLRTEFGPLVVFIVAVAFAYMPARAIALWRTDRSDLVEPRIIPLRICMVITGLITFGPALAAMAGWVSILPAVGAFLAGMILMSWAAAVFSDGYQGLWLDALIFHGNLTPPEEDWVNRKL